MTERRQYERRGTAVRRQDDRFGRAGDRRRVLIVEPHEDTRTLYSMLFEEAGHAVTVTADGLCAIAVAQQTLPDIVVMEMVVPGADGFEILRQLRAASATSDIPVIVATGSLHFDVPARAVASGAVLVLAKPITLDTLLAATDDVLAGVSRERLARRRLMRAVLMIRAFARQCAPDAAAQDRIRSFIDRLQVAVLAIDEQGRYVAASRGITELTGYSRQQLLRMSVFDSGLALAEGWQQAQQERESIRDLAIQDARGQTIELHTTVNSVVANLCAAALVEK